MPAPMTPEERATIRRDHEQRFVACSCNWSTPCVTIRLLDEVERLEDRLSWANEAIGKMAQEVPSLTNPNS